METNLAFNFYQNDLKEHISYQPTFVDLCSGIGGGRLGLCCNDYICKGFSEIDAKAIKTYQTFYNECSFLGDLTKIDKEKLNNIDVLIAGFPCQTFSIVGKRKGLDDERGQIIFNIANILKDKAIPYFILENVKGLTNINKGKALKEILELLSSSGYYVYYKILNSYDYGTPQIRERIYFVGIKKTLPNNIFEFPKAQKHIYDLSKYLISNDEKHLLKNNPNKYQTFIKYLDNKYNCGEFNLDYILQNEFLVLDTRQSDLRLYQNRLPTLRKGRQGILYVKNGVLRSLSAEEALLLQGFSMDLIKKVKTFPDSVLLEQAGNAMTVNVVNAISKELKKIILQNKA